MTKFEVLRRFYEYNESQLNMAARNPKDALSYMHNVFGATEMLARLAPEHYQSLEVAYCQEREKYEAIYMLG